MIQKDFETLLGLVSRYSPSGQEQEAVHWLVERMSAIGFDRAFRDAVGNAVGVIGDGPHQVVLLGHIDTVPGEIAVKVQDGWLHGRGTVDAKGPLAVFVDAAAQIGRRHGWQIIVIGAVEEERNSEGARFVARQYQPDYAIIGEPNGWQRIGIGYKGSAWATLTVRQDQEHPASGQDSASETAVLAWERIRNQIAIENQGRLRLFDKILPSLRRMESGEDGFSQWARLDILTRLPLDLTPDNWYAHLANLAGERVEVEPQGFAIPAYQCSKNTPVMRAFLSSIRAAGGVPGFVLKTGTADLNIVGAAWEKNQYFGGALVYGPGDSTLDHTPQERIEIAEYHRSVKVVTNAVESIIT